jgi:hypothetical protein
MSPLNEKVDECLTYLRAGESWVHVSSAASKFLKVLELYSRNGQGAITRQPANKSRPIDFTIRSVFAYNNTMTSGRSTLPEGDSLRNKQSIAAILPVFNEEKNVGPVLEVLRQTVILDELILVNDGSTDGTAEVLVQAGLRDPRIRILTHETNKGKGQAVFSGWAATSAFYLVLLDADLKNLKPYHIQVLLDPILQHRADMTLGLFSGGRLSTDLSHRLTPFLTGQRGLRSEILKYISREAATGYGFEVALTIGAQQHGYRKKVVFMKSVWHPSSELRTERGFWQGSAWKLRMYGQIVRAWYIATHHQQVEAEPAFSNPLKS